MCTFISARILRTGGCASTYRTFGAYLKKDYSGTRRQKSVGGVPDDATKPFAAHAEVSTLFSVVANKYTSAAKRPKERNASSQQTIQQKKRRSTVPGLLEAEVFESAVNKQTKHQSKQTQHQTPTHASIHPCMQAYVRHRATLHVLLALQCRMVSSCLECVKIHNIGVPHILIPLPNTPYTYSQENCLTVQQF